MFNLTLDAKAAGQLGVERHVCHNLYSLKICEVEVRTRCEIIQGPGVFK